MKFNGGLRLFAPLLLCLQATDLVKSYGAFFPASLSRGRPSSMSRGRTNSRSRYNPYKNSAPAGVFCKNGQFAYGCCKGWQRNAFGQCQPVCESRCMHGRCIGPNRCQCDAGWKGKTCNQDYNECAVRPCAHRCMNTQGSYKCYCEHGYLLLPDGRSCTADDRCYKTRCAFGCLQFEDGFRCYCPDGLQLTSDGLGCQDIDECADGQRRCAKNRRCVNTYGNYMCLCPEGYHYAYVEGSLDCVDMNECDMKMDKCDENAHCINAPNGYDCQCNQGYIGDGYRCIELDSRSCSSVPAPCFPGTDCVDTEVDISTIDLDQTDSARSFKCGECPSGLAGDGIDCAPSQIELRILVTDTTEDLSVPSAEVTAFDLSNEGRRLTSSLTDNNGVAVIEVPMFSDLILTASKESYVDNSVTYQTVPGGNPFLEIGITRVTDEIVGTYNPQEEASFRFTRSADNSFLGAINIPRGGLDVAAGTDESAYMIVPDAGNATELGLAPVLQADPSSAPIQPSQLGQEGALSGLAESLPLRGNGRTQNGKKISNKRGKGNRQTPRRGSLADDASVQDSLQIETNLPNPSIKKSPLDAVALAYISLRDDQGDVRDRLLQPLIIEIPLSKYENKGLQHGDEMAAWRYDDIHGRWTHAGTGVIRSLPGDPNSLIFVYETTHLGWIAAASLAQSLKKIIIFTCTDATCRKRVPHVPLWLHGMDSVYAELVTTDNNGKGEIVVRQGSKFTLEHRCNGKSKHFHGSSDVKQIDLTIHGEFECPDPGEPDNGVRFGDDFTFGSEVTYFCFAGYNMQGSSRRFCNGCGIWSGYQTFCVENVDSDFSSLSSLQHGDYSY